jgi:hypothetical protein
MRRVVGDLREWAKLLAFLGASAAVAGFLLGEAFGFKVGGLIGSPELLHLVEEHGEAKQFNIAEVQRLLIFTILLGVVHIIVGYVLSIVKHLKEGEAGEALSVKAPSLAMYLFGILFALAFFRSWGRYPVDIYVHQPRTPTKPSNKSRRCCWCLRGCCMHNHTTLRQVCRRDNGLGT